MFVKQLFCCSAVYLILIKMYLVLSWISYRRDFRRFKRFKLLLAHQLMVLLINNSYLCIKYIMGGYGNQINNYLINLFLK